MSERPRFTTAAIRKSRDLAVLIPLFWILLIMPPVVTLFAVDLDVAGIPLLLLYLLVVWLGGIGATAWNARRLAAAEDPEPVPPPPSDTNGGPPFGGGAP